MCKLDNIIGIIFIEELAVSNYTPFHSNIGVKIPLANAF